MSNQVFSFCHNLITVEIKEGTSVIGAWAFQECLALESVTIPDSITSIADDAFEGDLFVSIIASVGMLPSLLWITGCHT